MNRHLEIALNVEWSTKQWEFIVWRAPPDELGRPRIERACALGQYGGGKTFAAAGRFLAVCFENPYIHGAHKQGDLPMSGIVAPTMAGLHQGALRELLRICDPRLIADRRLYGIHQDITLINGHVIKLYSTKGAIEGPSLCQIWCDEIQHPSYVGKWANIRARPRDARARRLNLQVSGIAQYGEVERLFRKPPSPSFNLVMFRTADNLKMAAGQLEMMLDSVPASEMDTDADGWQPPRNVCWPKFSALANMSVAPLINDEIYKLPASAGVDLRRHAAVIISVPWSTKGGGKGLLLLDQLLPENQSAEQIVASMRATRWIFGEGSVLCLDPTASIDEVNQFRRGFPKARVIQAKTAPYNEARVGRRAVDRAICDARGVVRLFVHPRLNGAHERGVVETIRSYSELKLKDDRFEHMADAARYLVQHELPLPNESPYHLEPEDPRLQATRPMTAGLTTDGL